MQKLLAVPHLGLDAQEAPHIRGPHIAQIKIVGPFKIYQHDGYH